ncbi:uncharacterized protein AMSG_11028 [Thecamonas trahens ATCC 50062]|uniref:Uncharacterized protein n=1 Tax=Thecamonas trahens ATCC 50062 TaxID=461836 RepID=A0A0L0DT15_THETB|nr:hypothetical protein AMSG_11028 [Thecamonas trahens ATCC 50062]KNC55372.1 hypothetical protein AMSG_11028 [Thecamonas trahens ATCC 50062]|eukprot:XP_013753006.1 hypothetical protein AMSG_11028 [Thecamonas trahens ATCC 50062]
MTEAKPEAGIGGRVVGLSESTASIWTEAGSVSSTGVGVGVGEDGLCSDGGVASQQTRAVDAELGHLRASRALQRRRILWPVGPTGRHARGRFAEVKLLATVDRSGRRRIHGREEFDRLEAVEAEVAAMAEAEAAAKLQAQAETGSGLGRWSLSSSLSGSSSGPEPGSESELGSGSGEARPAMRRKRMLFTSVRALVVCQQYEDIAWLAGAIEAGGESERPVRIQTMEALARAKNVHGRLPAYLRWTRPALRYANRPRLALDDYWDARGGGRSYCRIS